MRLQTETLNRDYVETKERLRRDHEKTTKRLRRNYGETTSRLFGLKVLVFGG